MHKKQTFRHDVRAHDHMLIGTVWRGARGWFALPKASVLGCTGMYHFEKESDARAWLRGLYDARGV